MKLAITLLLAAVLPLQAQFTTNQPADVVLGQTDFVSSAPGAGANKFNVPADIAIDPATGKVFVAEITNHRVLRFSSASAMTSGSSAEAVLGQPDFATVTSGNDQFKMNFPVSLAIDTGGRLWVADRNNHRVLRFDGAATALTGAGAVRVFGQAGFGVAVPATTQDGMNAPSAVEIGTDGTLWVAELLNNRLLRFDDAAAKFSGPNADGVLGQSDFGSNAAGASADSFNQPAALAISPSGTLFIADTDNNRVLRFDAAALAVDGADANSVLGQTNLNGSIAPGLSRTALEGPSGLALDVSGNLFVSDTDNNRVQVFAAAATAFEGAPASLVLGQPDFDTATELLSATSAPSPRGLAFDPAGRLFVAQPSAHRITRFSPAVPPTPPAADTTRPTIRVKGRRSVDSLRNRVVFRGTASDADAVAGIEFRVSGQASFQQARGTTSWKAVVRPDKNKRKTVVRVRAIDAAGNKSRFLKLKIFRR